MPSSAVPPASSSATKHSVVLRPPVPRGEPARLGLRTRVRLVGAGTLAVVAGVLGAIAMVRSGEPLPIAMGLTTGAILVLGCFVIVRLVFWRRDGRIEVVPVRGGIELPPAKTACWIAPVGIALVLAFAGILIVGGLVGVDLRGGRFTDPIAGVVLAAIFLVVALRSPLTPSSVPRIVLTPDGIGKRRAQRTRLLDWDDVATPVLRTERSVEAILWRRSETLPAGADPRRVLDEPHVAIPFALYMSDPNLVLALIEHYRTHPGDRAELAGPEVIDRLRRGDLDTSQ